MFHIAFHFECRDDLEVIIICAVLSWVDMVQVEVTRTYTARQPDELSLQVAEVVLVSQKVDDGQ